MTTAVTVILLGVGLVLIMKGGDIFVDAASWMAKVSGIPQFIIGATVVSLATTLPEMLVSFLAAGQGKVDMAVGNAIGSVTVNTGLIMGIAVVCMPMAVKRAQFMPKALLMVGGAALVVLCGLGGAVNVLPGIALVAVFVVAMIDNVHQARAAMKQDRESGGQVGGQGDRPALQASYLAEESGEIADAYLDGGAVAIGKPRLPTREIAANMLKFVLGAAAIVVGAQLLVDNGSALALLLGVSERVIGVTVVAVGTSLPELVTTITAIRKKQGSLSIGNIVGANIIDIALIMPLCSLIAGKPLPISAQMAAVDLPACLIICAVAVVPTLVTKKFYRAQGVVMIAAYGVYLAVTTGL